MMPMDQQPTEQVVFCPRDTSGDDDELTGPPHKRSEQRIEELWREMERADGDWLICLTGAVGHANRRTS